MNPHWWIGFLSSFLASTVEVVEAVTLVLATGVTRGWRSTWLGVGTASLTLVIIVLAFGPALLTIIPLDTLRVVVGTLLLLFGLQWLRKAILRYTGLVALHDETKIYSTQVAALRTAPDAATGGMDWTAFALAFKAVLLEGLEVVFIVITFGLTAGDFGPAIFGALAAAVVVSAFALGIQQPLSRVPENTLKFIVGLMLTGFGTFWVGEGIGLDWPGGDLAILGLIIFYAAWSLGLIAQLRRPAPSGKAVTEP